MLYGTRMLYKLVIISVHIHIQLYVINVRCCIYSTSSVCQNGAPGGYILDHSSVPRFRDVSTDSSVCAVWILISVETSLTPPIPGRPVIERYIQRVLS